jgi:hypothetical protein
VSVARVYRAFSPYNADQLAELDYEQSADTMYLAHLQVTPTKLIRTAHTNWTFSTVTFAPTLAAPTGVGVVATQPNVDAANSGNSYYPTDQRYVVTAIDDDTGQESRVSSIVTANNDLNLKRNYNTLTWSAVTGAERYRVYKSDITADFGYIDYPSTVTFFQQRLGWARTSNHPNAAYFSRSGEYENMDISRPLKASDALSFALLAGKVNAVNQLVPMSNLLALTSDSVFSINGGSDGFISPTNIVTSRENGRGGSRLNPIVVDDVSFYQTAVGSAVRTLGFRFETDGYASNDVTIFSPHLFKGHTIVSWAYCAEPLSVIYAARDDGILLAFTWQQEQQVWGWTLCETDGLVESVCSISEAGEDRLYLVVKRTVQNVEKRYIERLATSIWDEVGDSAYMDSAVTFSFTTPTALLTNLQHLEGKEVVALADGAVVDGLTVTAGSVTLPAPASQVTVGLPFTAIIETLPLAIQTSKGWTLAKPQQIATAVLKVKDSRGFLVGPSDDKLVEPRPRNNEPFGSAPDMMSGYVEAILKPHISNVVTVVVQSSTPLPLTVTEVLFDPKVSE